MEEKSLMGAVEDDRPAGLTPAEKPPIDDDDDDDKRELR